MYKKYGLILSFLYALTLVIDWDRVPSGMRSSKKACLALLSIFTCFST